MRPLTYSRAADTDDALALAAVAEDRRANLTVFPCREHDLTS
ncbi:MAG: hypothetical protein JWP07_364 [Pseudonocardiales bacterium]|jgi:hypothetical protein|nr:hypothetical protein [Pseudonocardiales bacterium]